MIVKNLSFRAITRKLYVCISAMRVYGFLLPEINSGQAVPRRMTCF